MIKSQTIDTSSLQNTVENYGSVWNILQFEAIHRQSMAHPYKVIRLV